MEFSSDIGVIGGGVAGLCCARELARGGASVTLVERGQIGAGASHAAAGMLAPLVEARLEEPEVVRFGAEALAGYAGFVAGLEDEVGMSLGLRTNGTLVVATDRDEVEQIEHLFEEHTMLGLPIERLNGYECRRIEPGLSPSVPAGLFSPNDMQVDNRALLISLAEACRRNARITVIENAGEGRFDDPAGSRRYTTDRARIVAQVWVIATGAWSDVLRELLPDLARIIRPVKGQILRLDHSAAPLVDHVVRTPRMYLVPKSDGRLVLGASSEDRGFDASITAGEIYELLRAAFECVPAIYDVPIVETMVGFRPAAIDHLPLIGRTSLDDIYLATGYYRHGILFAPLAAELLAAAVTGNNSTGSTGGWIESFSPERFDGAYSKR